MNLNNIIQIVGVPASGKNYITNQLRNKNKKVNYLCFSEIMQEIFEKNNIGKTHKTELSYLDKENRDFIIEKGLEEVIKKQPVVLNTHMIYKTNEGDIKKTGKDYELELGSKGYIHLFSPIDQIIKRIERDRYRKKRFRNYSKEEIKFMQEKSIDTAREISKKMGSEFYLIKNGEHKNKGKIERINKIINQIFQK